MTDTTNQYDELANRAGDDAVPGSKSSKKDDGAGVQHKRSLLKAAKDYREKIEWDRKASDFIKVYANQYPYEELDDYEDIVVPNMVFSTVNVIVPSVAVNNPEILVYADQQEDEMFAEVAEAMLNHQWRQGRVQPEVRDATKDSVITGLGWAKVTWEYVEEEVDRPAEEIVAEVTQRIGAKRAAIQESPELEDRFPSDEEIVKNIDKKATQVKFDRPKVQRISPFDVFVDPDVDVMRDARWIAHRMFVPLSEARANEDWSATVRAALKPTRRSEARDKVDVAPDRESGVEHEEAFVEVYEFYDLLTGQMCVFAESTPGYLQEPEDSVFDAGHPFVLLTNYEVPERFFPMGDVEPIFPLQLELAMVRTAQINDRKRGRRITLIREDALGSEGVEDLRDGKDNVMIKVIRKDIGFDDVFQQISSQGLQPEWYRADQQAMEDINTVSGVAEYMRGGAADIRRTATEVGVMADMANARSSDKLSKVEDFMSQIAERMLVLSQKFLDTPQVARVVSDSMAVNWVPFTPDNIQGEFSLSVAAGSSQPRNESFRRQQANQMMEQFGPLIGSGFLNDQEFLAEIMRLQGWTDVERFLGPGPAPMPPEPGTGAEPVPPPEAPPGAVPA